nr:nucleotidyltransferase domain-containing protein [Nanoarchaeota archaeon]
KLTDLTKQLTEKINYDTVILFGSLIKGETTVNSDIDIYLDSKEKEIGLKEFEKKLKRRIQLHFRNELNNIHLKKNIQEGLLLNGVMI